MSAYNIRYLERHEIDDDKWNMCISSSPNGLIYGYSFFLDNMAKRWDGLILNDYQAVMPLTWNSKFGIKYLYQPAFTQQLGVFYKDELPNIIDLFIAEIKKHFRFADIHFNHSNNHQDFISRANYILSLAPSYDEVSGNYKTDLRNNLRRAAKFQLEYRKSDDPDQALHLFKKQYSRRIGLKYDDLSRFKKLCRFAVANNMLIVREIYYENRIIASALLLHKNKRMYLLQDAAVQHARKLSANHFLLDNLIKEFSNSDYILDFEGSSIPGIAHFYKNFGAVEQSYFKWYYNELPWPVRLYKQNKYSR